MKVSTVKPEFQPVVITLETQEEVDQMFQLSKINGFKGSKCDLTLEIFDKLESLASDQEYEYKMSQAFVSHRKVE